MIDEELAKDKHKDFGSRMIKTYGKTTIEEQTVPLVLITMKEEQKEYLPAYRPVTHVYTDVYYVIADKEYAFNTTPGTYPDSRWFPYELTFEELYLGIDYKGGAALDYMKGYFVRVGTNIYLVIWKDMPTELNLEDVQPQKTKRFR